MIGLPESIAIFSGCAVIIAGILRFKPRRKNNPANLVSKPDCENHREAIKELFEVKFDSMLGHMTGMKDQINRIADTNQKILENIQI